MNLKFDGWLFLVYFKLCVKFHSHRSILMGVTVLKRPILVKISDVCPMWPWNMIDDLKKEIKHLFQSTSSFVYHLVAIGEFKLESGNAHFGSKSEFFVPCDLEIWRMTLTTRHLFYATAKYVHHFVALCEFKLELWSGKAQIRGNLLWHLWIWLLTSGLDLLHGHHVCQCLEFPKM